MTNLSTLKTEALATVASLTDLTALEDARVKLLGKSGAITEHLKKLGSLPAEERRDYGQQVNAVKIEVQTALETKKQALEAAAVDAKLAAETVDVSLPAMPAQQGRLHPTTATIMEVEQVLQRLGFAPTTGPEVESDDYNFTKLNLPEEHPARQDHDTFYLPAEEGATQRHVLRTQTSNVQIHTMEKYGVPLRVQHIGRVYRSDYDRTHTPQFHQIEGLAIDTNITFADLRGILQRFLEDFFERPIKMRMRPHYFPFTEPSAEVDVWWEDDKKGGRWLEVLGSGMVHRNVLNGCGIDHTQYQGFAFGCGVERLAMLKYGMTDLRLFYESHRTFLEHFGTTLGKQRIL